MLTVTDLSVAHDGVPAVRDASIAVQSGEAIAIVGANGAGKTSLLDAICGFAAPQSGHVLFDGRELGGLPPHRIARLGVAFVPARRHLFADMTVHENLTLGAHKRGAHPSARDDVLTLFPRLGERHRQLAGSLSGGEQQMLAIGRALMGQPRVLILDEPTSGLAPMLAEQTYAALAELRSGGLTVLIAEQQLHLVLAFADRGYVMSRGTVTAEGPTQQLAEHPALRSAYPGA